MQTHDITRRAAAVARADWGPYLRRAAFAVATVAAAVYAAGYVSGAWIHRINDRLAGVTPPQPVPALTIAAPALPPLTVPQLRTMARQRLGPAARIGGRRIAQARKADLLTALGAQ